MNPTPELAPSHVVGIGASAGGLEALERFFHALPEDTGMAFVVVQHLSPDFKSLMDELLARHTRLPIALVEDGMLVQANHVYLIPPKKEMIISGGRLLLSERERSQELTLPIDTFFRSLARDCGARAVAIVLSGGGSDGSRGARDVHDAGGLVIVQDAASAQFDGMPKASRDSGIADYLLAPSDMPRVLVDHAANRGSLPPDIDVSRENIGETRDAAAVYDMLKREFGIDFTHYKPSTVTRRIERRLALARSQNIAEYVDHLRSDKEELDLLYRDLLIGVTRFFRDDKAFAALEQDILPDLLRQTEDNGPLRVWIAGCATGEEAYSLAISLQDVMAKLSIERPVKIFATDVHRGSLEIAARGIYDEQAIANVSPERLERYFFRIGNTYQVVPELRSMIVFAAHNVIKDAPFTRVDLISCRNLLIYLQPAAQQKALSLFHFALNRGGTLFLGPSESTGTLTADFETVNKHWRLYRKFQDQRLPSETHVPSPARLGFRSQTVLPTTPARYSLTQLLGTYDALLDEVMPPALLVSDRGELVQSFNGASKLLSMRDGRQDLDVFDLVSTELKMVLVGGVKRALNDQGLIAFKGVKLGVPNDDRPYKVTMRRIRSRTAAPPHVLISFEVMESIADSGERKSETEIDIDQVSHEQLRALEFELSHTKENLQAAIEELETSNEELQASNEELQSSNEELQSTNEELQSVNEELYTVNSEYQRKIAELTELTNDMDNLLSSTDIGTIFLDNALRIRKFTPQIGEAFSLLPHDVGRPIETFAHKLQHPELVDDLKRVLETAEPIERELDGVAGKSLFCRILPYRTKGTVIGVVLTLIDVSSMKAAEDALFHERYLLNSLLSSEPDAIYFKDARGRFIRANEAVARMFGASDARELVGKAPFDVPNREIAVALHEKDEAVLRSGEAQLYSLEQREQPDGSVVSNLVTRLALRAKDGSIVGVGAVIRDVTAQKRAEAKSQEAVTRRDQFLAMLSHELRNPLGAIVTATNLLKNEGDHADSRERLLEMLERQSQQMARLLDDLLEASRVTQNKIELRKSRVDLTESVRESAEAMRDAMAARELTFETHLPNDHLFAEADPARLQQIHVNLLSNAAKYTPRGGHVNLELRREDGHAVIEVGDDGMGIPADMIDSVFDLFVQSHRTLDRSAGGLGVGLTLTRWLVSLHGGTIEAKSDGEGKGSSFRVRLPLSSSVVKREKAQHERPRIPAGAKIVIVEDNADSRELLCEFLSRVGFECHTAENGAEAITLIEEVKPDVAILDVGLPEMDGFEVARRLRADPRWANLFLIALTGYGRSSDRTTSHNAGFDEHLVKPVQPDDLLGVLASYQRGGRREQSHMVTVPTAE
jgi:two-component system CheB/CheR fusion protein